MMQRSGNRGIIRLEETESTNTYLKALVRQQRLEEGLLVTADYQTCGRGQKGNTWFSGRGENLLFSLVIYPENIEAKNQFLISRVVSLAVKNTLDRFTDDICIKWPNDIYWEDKKIAGILIENDLQGNRIENSIIGVGLNLNQEDFPADLPNPVSLKQITRVRYRRETLLDLFMCEFFDLYRESEQRGSARIEEEYMLSLYRVNAYYWFEDAHGRFKAKIEGVKPSGELILRIFDTNRTREYAFKEVHFVMKQSDKICNTNEFYLNSAVNR